MRPLVNSQNSNGASSDVGRRILCQQDLLPRIAEPRHCRHTHWFRALYDCSVLAAHDPLARAPMAAVQSRVAAPVFFRPETYQPS